MLLFLTQVLDRDDAVLGFVSRWVAGLAEQVEVLRDQPEPYIALRRNYTQQRAAAIRDGREQEDPFKDLPDFDDYDFGDEDEFESQE